MGRLATHCQTGVRWTTSLGGVGDGMSKSLVAQGTPDALLLCGKVDRVLPQVSHGCVTQGAIVARIGHVKRSLKFESLAAQSAQTVTCPHSVGPQLRRSRSEHSQRLLG